jgi:hypothetical protein
VTVRKHLLLVPQQIHDCDPGILPNWQPIVLQLPEDLEIGCQFKEGSREVDCRLGDLTMTARKTYNFWSPSLTVNFIHELVPSTFNDFLKIS